VSASAPKAEKIGRRFTGESVARVTEEMAASRPECVAMVTVQEGLGLRLGELVGLRVGDVDYRKGTVRIGCQITGTASKVRTDELKTDRSGAVIVAPRYVIDAIREHLATYPTAIDGSVFSLNGEPWAQGTYRRAWRAALQRAGLPGTWRTHDLRHYRATEMIAAGMTYEQVARFLREKVETVIATYSHPVDDEDAVAKELDEAWNRQRRLAASF
jgi:integrase